MKTELRGGTLFVMRYEGESEINRVNDDCQTIVLGVTRAIEVGEVIHRCVWKPGDRLESRASYTIKPGDVEWVDTGVPGIRGGIFAGRNVFHNRFSDVVPAWLRATNHK